MDKKNNELNKALKAFEECVEPISELDIEQAIIKLKKDLEASEFIVTEEMKAEQMAFAFWPNFIDKNGGWGTYYGPQMVLPNEAGQTVEYPSIQHVTKEIISYWAKRAIEANHPIMKYRYADLVWDFSKAVTQENSSPEMARIVIDATLEIASHGMHKYENATIEKLERALSLSLSLKDDKRQKNAVKAIISFEDNVAKDEKPGLWGFSFDLLMKNKRIPVSESQKIKIIAGLEERLNQFSKLDKPKPYDSEFAAIPLAGYYRKENQTEKVKEVLIKFGNVCKKAAENDSPIAASALLQKVYSVFLNFGLKNEADSIAVLLREINKKSKDDLKEISHKTSIPTEKVENFVEEMLKGDIELALERITIYFISNRDQVEEQVKELSKKHVMPYLVTTMIQDHKGRPVAKIGSIEDDLDGHVVKQMSQNISFSAFFLRRVIEGFIEKFSPDNANIVEYLYKSPVFDEDKREIIEKGIGCYLEKDFISSVHLLIPQIEDAFRHLIELAGGAIYKPGRFGGLNSKTFDEILRDQIVADVFDQNTVFYLRVLFTDSRSWNLRNTVCHGLIPSTQVNEVVADRVFHALLLLGRIRKQD